MKIGIDVGGSHVGLGLVNDKGQIICKKEKDYLRTEKDMSSMVISTIKELLNQIFDEQKCTIESIGIAFPGTVSNGVVVKADNLGIANLEIVEILKKDFRFPIFLQNDAKCAAIAEKEYGSLKQYEDSIFLIIGTGVGGAVFLDNKLLKPKRYSGFEIGHMVIKENGIKCNCGRNGCFECYGSMKRLKIKISNDFNLNSIDGIIIREFMEENKDNKKLNEILDTYIKDLVVGIANLINIFEPEAVSIGGSFAHYKDILLEKLENELASKEELFNKGEVPKIVFASLKNDAGIIGASMLK